MLTRKVSKLNLAVVCPNAPTFVGALALNQAGFEARKLFPTT